MDISHHLLSIYNHTNTDTQQVQTKRIEGHHTLHELKQSRDEYQWKVKTSSHDDDVRAHGVTWKEALVLAFGGLRGAVGLALAIIVVEESHSNQYVKSPHFLLKLLRE